MLGEALEEGFEEDMSGNPAVPGPATTAAAAALVPVTMSEACWLPLAALQSGSPTSGFMGSHEGDGIQLPTWEELQLLQPPQHHQQPRLAQLQLQQPTQLQPRLQLPTQLLQLPPQPQQQRQGASDGAELTHRGGAPAAVAGALPCGMLLAQPATPAAAPAAAPAPAAPGPSFSPFSVGESSATSFVAACAMAASGMQAWVAAGAGACASADALAYLAWLKRRAAGPGAGAAEQAACSFMSQVLLALLAPADGAIVPRAHALALLDRLCGALLALQAKLGAGTGSPADAVAQWLEELGAQPASAEGTAVFELACMLRRARSAW